MRGGSRPAWRLRLPRARPLGRLARRLGRFVRKRWRQSARVAEWRFLAEGVWRDVARRWPGLGALNRRRGARPGEGGPVRRLSALRFDLAWVPMAGAQGAEIAHTATRLGFHVGTENLTRNQTVWSDAVHESVLVSAYPLALWLASSWWRLHWEPLLAPGMHITLQWRSAHEMEGAGFGFVWPRVLFASDGEAMQVWAVAAHSRNRNRKAVRYLTGTKGPVSVPLTDFTQGVDDFLAATVWRLKVRTRLYGDSTLRTLWDDLRGDRADPRRAQWRRCEAELGFSLGQCPDDLMKKALALKGVMGPAVSELLPAHGKAAGLAFVPLEALAGLPGIAGRLVDPRAAGARTAPQGASWAQAALIAREIRMAIGVVEGPLEDEVLYDLLGVPKDTKRHTTLGPTARAAVAIPGIRDEYRILIREGDRPARRFEWARLFADFLLPEEARGPWLASTDLMTWRQKYQRALAAELLCPIGALKAYLNGNTSPTGVDLAARDFGVPIEIVEAVLAYNDILSSRVRFGEPKTGFPYCQGRFASEYAWLPGGKGVATFR